MRGEADPHAVNWEEATDPPPHLGSNLDLLGLDPTWVLPPSSDCACFHLKCKQEGHTSNTNI